MLLYTDASLAKHVNELSAFERPERLPAALAGAEAARRAGARVERRAFEPADPGLLREVHAPEYLNLLRSTAESGGGTLDPDTAMNEHSWSAARLAAGAAAAAAESALSGTPAFAVVRPPGHHAESGRAMGFCYLNNAAAAASRALARGAGRVAVLDWDVHHGNGVQEIFYSDPRVLYLSVHRSPFYPGTGAAEETGEGPGEGFTVNVPLPARSGTPVYAAAFAGVLLPVLREFEPGLVVVSAGYDAHRRDPLGGMELDERDFGDFAAALRREAPLALVLEGGYDLKALAASVRETVLGAESGGPPVWRFSDDLPEPVRRARRILSRYWEGMR